MLQFDRRNRQRSNTSSPMGRASICWSRPAGGNLWRLKYRLAGKEKLMAFGAYPEVSLADARKRRDEAREQIAASKDPSREKRRTKVRQRAEAMNTFAIISAEYCAKRKMDGQGGWSPATVMGGLS